MTELRHFAHFINIPDPVARHETAESAGAIKPSSPEEHLAGQLIERYGHLHSEAIFTHWSPAAIKAMGIRRVEAEGGAQ